jgi:hypothetical protein
MAIAVVVDGDEELIMMCFFVKNAKAQLCSV